MRKTCLTQTPFSTVAWLCLRLTTYQMLRRQPWRCAALLKQRGSWQPLCGNRSPANELYGCFWDAVEAIDETAKRPFGRQGSYGSAEALSQLWNGAGLTDIEATDLLMRCQFSSFNELWQRCLNAEGPAGVCMERLSADRREALKKRLRQNVLGDSPDGPFSLKATAGAVRGVVP